MKLPHVPLRDIFSVVFTLLVVYLWVVTPPLVILDSQSGARRSDVAQYGRGATRAHTIPRNPSLDLKLELYVIFHERVLEGMYSRGLNATRYWKYFLFIGVNPDIPKIPAPAHFRTVMESALLQVHGLHLSGLQQEDWKEYSVMKTVYDTNRTVLSGAKYVGFTQYDMRFNLKVFHLIHTSIESSLRNDAANTKPCCIFYASTYPSRYMFEGDIGDRLLADYNAHYGTDVLWSDIATQAIIDTFIIPHEMFRKVMAWVGTVMVRLEDFQSPVPGHEIVEKAVGLALAIEEHTTRKVQLPIRHEHVSKQQ